MSSLKCPNCNFTNFALEENCKKCGESLKAKKNIRRKQEIPPDACVCTNCGVLCKPFEKTRGTAWVDGILLLTAIISGLFFSLMVGAVLFLAAIGATVWRMNSKYAVCPQCEKPNPIPANSPAAQKILANLRN
jgi:hypothetical protein